MSDDGDYEVGYKKPPKPSRFKKGESGNPNGKKKGSRNRATRLEEFFDTPIPVIDDGRRRLMAPDEIIIKKVFNLAAKGNIQAAKLLFSLRGDLAPNVATAERNTADLQVMARRFDKLMGADEPRTDD